MGLSLGTFQKRTLGPDVLRLFLVLPLTPSNAYLLFRVGENREIPDDSGYIHIYTASANITPAPRDHLHGEICTLLLRERADIEVAGYMQEKCSRSVFTQKYTEYD